MLVMSVILLIICTACIIGVMVIHYREKGAPKVQGVSKPLRIMLTVVGTIAACAVIWTLLQAFGFLGFIMSIFLGLLGWGIWALVHDWATIVTEVKRIGWTGFLPATTCFILGVILLIYALITGKWWAWAIAIALLMASLWLLCKAMPFCQKFCTWCKTIVWPKIKVVFGVLMVKPFQWLYALSPKRAKAVIIGTVAGLITWWLYGDWIFTLRAWEPALRNWKTFLWLGLTALAFGSFWMILPKLIQSFLKKRWTLVAYVVIGFELFFAASPLGGRWPWVVAGIVVVAVQFMANLLALPIKGWKYLAGPVLKK